MAIFTKQAFAQQAQKYAHTRSFTDIIKGALNESSLGQQVSVFLSHSHLDREMIEAGIVFFKGLNVRIYVDWADKTMPEETNAITAINIKRKIDSNKKFILLATNNAVVSKWCNWELGIGDSKKLLQDNLAIIPLADNNGDWKGNEYLQMYPAIEKSDIYQDKYKVTYPNRDVKYLEDWL